MLHEHYNPPVTPMNIAHLDVTPTKQHGVSEL